MLNIFAWIFVYIFLFVNIFLFLDIFLFAYIFFTVTYSIELVELKKKKTLKPEELHVQWNEEKNTIPAKRQFLALPQLFVPFQFAVARLEEVLFFSVVIHLFCW